MADLLAYPCKQAMLFEEGKIEDPEEVLGKEVWRCTEAKYNRHLFDGRVRGYGQVFLT